MANETRLTGKRGEGRSMNDNKAIRFGIIEDSNSIYIGCSIGKISVYNEDKSIVTISGHTADNSECIAIYALDKAVTVSTVYRALLDLAALGTFALNEDRLKHAIDEIK